MYEFPNGVTVAAGYTIKYNFPIDTRSEPYKWADQRAFEQAEISKPFRSGNIRFKQRFRLEERWLARKTSPDFDRVTSYVFQTRFRYEANFEFGGRAKTYWVVSDEVFFRLYPTADVKIFEQNRLFAGIGIRLDQEKLWRLEIGYMLQDVRNSPEILEGSARINHVLRVTLRSNAPFTR
jgi:hypothetical protein